MVSTWQLRLSHLINGRIGLHICHIHTRDSYFAVINVIEFRARDERVRVCYMTFNILKSIFHMIVSNQLIGITLAKCEVATGERIKKSNNHSQKHKHTHLHDSHTLGPMVHDINKSKISAMCRCDSRLFSVCVMSI